MVSAAFGSAGDFGSGRAGVSAWSPVAVRTSMDRIWVEDELAPIHEWLADYYDQRGDRAAAVRHYARFIEIWQQADPELQPRVASARERLQQLQPDR